MTNPEIQAVDVARTRADYLKYSAIIRNTFNLQTYSLTAWIVAAIAVGSVHEWLSDLPWVQKHIFYDYGALYWGAVAGVFYLAVLLIYRVITFNITYVKPGENFMRPQRYEIGAEGIKDTSNFGNSFMTWKGITNILRTREYLLFYVDSMSAHIIPVRSFPSKDAADAFYKNARALWQAATQANPAGK